MFTGLVEDRGSVTAIEIGAESAVISIKTSLASKINKGDSVSVNGVCLTAIEVNASGFSADVMIQTLRLTTLGSLKVSDPVNLELAAPSDGRLGGHIVQGHVDGVGEVVNVEPQEKWTKFVVKVPSSLARYIVNQGSIAIDGVSLTVGTIDDSDNQVTLWLIPETLAKTNLSSKSVGDSVNIEVDILAKYAERLMKRGGENE